MPESFERRRRRGGGGGPPRNAIQHSAKLSGELNQAVQAERQRKRPEFVDPSLILRVRMTGSFLEEEWNSVGLTVLSSDEDRTLVLFSSSEEMTSFRERLTAYAAGAPAGQKHPRYAGFIGNIESIGVIEPRDRIGIRARED